MDKTKKKFLKKDAADKLVAKKYDKKKDVSMKEMRTKRYGKED